MKPEDYKHDWRKEPRPMTPEEYLNWYLENLYNTTKVYENLDKPPKPKEHADD